MATKESVDSLIQDIDGAISYQNKDLISRADWGSISFGEAEADLEQIFSILGYLKVLPLQSLTNAAVIEIVGALKEVATSLAELDSFTIEQDQTTKRRDDIIQKIHDRAESFYTAATPWIPFLAYQKGDVAANIEALTSSVSGAAIIVENAEKDAKKAGDEIGKIVTAAREASAAAGAAVFTQDFKEESKSLYKSARGWLVATALLGLVAAGTAVGMLLSVKVGLDNNAVLQLFGAKVAFFAILISATLWCGRIYRAQMHLATVNKHRALSLQTFQAFSSAAAEPQTKEAVLMETTKAIFSASPSGFIDTGNEAKDQDIRIIDIARTPIARRAVEPD